MHGLVIHAELQRELAYESFVRRKEKKRVYSVKNISQSLKIFEKDLKVST